ncbi:MAG: hypothetical protein MCSN_0390 [Candidatus Microsyncoccus archaeolyticus]|nr:MAG: hypothetical protein MCSN_0390 [Candidatus Parcubacteria bacterium]
MQEADYSVLGYFLQTPFERRKSMFPYPSIVRHRTVAPHRLIEWQKKENAEKMAIQASAFEAIHK